MIRKIIRWPNPILSTPCKQVELSKADYLRVLADLRDTFQAHNNAAGLAAPQIGHGVRMLAMRVNGEMMIIVNPSIIKASSVFTTAEEGCLSMPWLKVKVARPHSVLVAFEGHAGEYQKSLSGLEARVFQHELDHLNGVTLDHHRRGVVPPSPAEPDAEMEKASERGHATTLH